MSLPQEDFPSRLREHLLSRGVEPAVINDPGEIHLASDRVLNSMLVLEVLLMVEEELGRELSEEELTNENFDSLDAICRLAFTDRAP